MIKTSPDFYAVDNEIWYITPCPLNNEFMYFMRINEYHKEISYGNMKRFKVSDNDHVCLKAVPLNIGWVPTYTKIKEEYPELLL